MNLNDGTEYNVESEYERFRNLSLKVTEKEEERLKLAGRLTVKETKEEGYTGFKVYLEYFRNFNWGLFTLMIFLYVIYAALRIISDFWLSYWAENRYPGLRSSLYPEIYCYLALALLIFLTFRAFIIAKGAEIAGLKLHNMLMLGLLKRPLSFFDTTPVGVILNRATRDMGDMDINMPNMYQHTIFNFLHILSIVVMIAIGNPIVIIFLVVLLVWYVMSSKDLGKVTADLKRVSQISSSPLISVIAESLRGSVSLKAYQRQEFQAYKYNLC